MATSPQGKANIDLMAASNAFDLSIESRKSDAEIAAAVEHKRLTLAHKLETSKASARHKRILEYIALVFLGCITVFCATVVYKTPVPNDSSRSSWTAIVSIISAVSAYAVGRSTK